MEPAEWGVEHYGLCWASHTNHSRVSQCLGGKSSSQFCIQFSHSLLSKFLLGNIVIQQAPGLAGWREIKLAKSIKSRTATAKQTLMKGWTAPRLDLLLSLVLQPHLTITRSVQI